MEAIQSYYMANNKQTPSYKKYIQPIAMQCVIDALCATIEHDDILNTIIFRKFPELDCGLDWISAISGCHTDEICENLIIGAIEIVPSPIVIPIKMVHGTVAENQYIIIDKMMKEVYLIDPTYETSIIINPCRRIAAFFQVQGYHCNSVLIKNQTSANILPKYRNSWSLFALIESLTQLQSPVKCAGTVHYSEKTQYLLLFDFYKDIVQHIPEVQRDLRHSFIEKMNHKQSQKSCKKIFETIIQLDPTEIILSTPGNDIIYAAFCGYF